MPSPMLTTVGIFSAHCKLVWRCSISFVRIGICRARPSTTLSSRMRQALLEQAAAELRGRLDRNRQHDIGDAGEGAGRLVRQRHHLGAFRLGDAGKAGC